jgi:hypothetical protein
MYLLHRSFARYTKVADAYAFKSKMRAIPVTIECFGTVHRNKHQCERPDLVVIDIFSLSSSSA